MRRNNTIGERQGTRNRFIDDPKRVEDIREVAEREVKRNDMDAGEQARGDRRGDLRWGVRGRPAGRMTPRHKATYQTVALVDISMGGALIELSTDVGPGALVFLTLLIHMVHGWEAGFMCQVVRSVVDRYDVDPTGRRDLVYRMGLKFLAPSEVSRRVVAEYIADGTIDALRRGMRRQHAEA